MKTIPFPQLHMTENSANKTATYRERGCSRHEAFTLIELLLLVGMIAILAASPSAWAQEGRFFRVTGPVSVTITSITAEGYVTWTNALTNATFTVQTTTTLGDESNWLDWVQVPVTNPVTTQRLFDPNTPAGMVFIPAGSFAMGNTFTNNEGDSDELPLHTVYVSAFFMDKYEVTKALWGEVYSWAITNGYNFFTAGSGKAANHPVQNIKRMDMLKWCNARSQKEGVSPCYYTSAAQTTLFQTGGFPLNTNDNQVNWPANGYRLPTEAEWEKAARGGTSRHPFLRSDAGAIQPNRANYNVYTSSATNLYAYDASPTTGFHPTFFTGDEPYTSPVGCFATNGYGLYDMAGNVWEACSDSYSASWYGNAGATRNDSHGPGGAVATLVIRGGACGNGASSSRCANRSLLPSSGSAGTTFGFRCVRAPIQ